ncbi:unnamed protein product [Spirodela intermedia]|uniref:PB1 domain-containing protein n=1 Tax=Spirodela intermedia TaxID=51605 RepID=A0ABN7EAU7_SPIIN|nr:unnamed protein product [Spirodela intermedia]
MAASHHHLSERSSGASAPPPPPTHRWHHHGGGGDGSGGEEPKVRLMCSFGGRILRAPTTTSSATSAGRPASSPSPALPPSLPSSPSSPSSLAYQLPHEDLDALISVSSDEDVEIMMEEYDRLAAAHGGGATAPRLRLFLFPAGGFGSLHDRWFLDALSSGPVAAAVAAPPLERAQSEASSVISELPDYPLGLDGVGGGGGAAAAEREGSCCRRRRRRHPCMSRFILCRPSRPVRFPCPSTCHMGRFTWVKPVRSKPVRFTSAGSR